MSNEVEEGPEDGLAARGERIASQDPLAVALRNEQPAGPNRRGFDIGMAVAEGQTLDGPGKQKQHDALKPAERQDLKSPLQFSLERNRNAQFAFTGAAIAEATPVLAAARTLRTSAFYSLGFDIATGIFGDPALEHRVTRPRAPGRWAFVTR